MTTTKPNTKGETMTTEIRVGKLFRVTFPLVENWGYCGYDAPPTAGDAMVCNEKYALVLADFEDLDDEGNLVVDEDFPARDQLEAEHVECELGWWDSDGTATIVLAKPGCNGDDDTFAITV